MKDEYIISGVIILAVITLASLVYVSNHPTKGNKKELTLAYVTDSVGNCFVLEQNTSRFSWIPCGLTPNVTINKELK